MPILTLVVTHVTLFAAIVMFALAVWAYFEHRTDPKSVTYSALLVTAALWTFSWVLWQVAGEARQDLFWVRTLYFIASLLPVFLFFFSAILARGRLPHIAIQILAFLPSVALFYVAYRTPHLVTIDPSGTLVFGAGRTLFAVHFALFFLLSVGLLFYGFRVNRDIERSAQFSVLIAITASFTAMFTALFRSIPSVLPELLWLGDFALLAGLLAISFSVLRYRFLADIRLAGMELLLLLTLFVLVMDVVVSESVLDFTFRLVVLIILVFYGALTIRTMVMEVQRLREIQTLNDELTKMNGHLIEADKTKSQFVSFASHQLRAPLGGIRSYMDMLHRGDFGPLSDKQREIVGIDRDALHHLSETIETFLDVAKIQLGKLELYKSETQFGDLVKRVVEEMSPLAEEKGLAFSFIAPPRLAPVHCDAGKLYHVLVNLIDNAIKYTKKGKVTVSVSRTNGDIVVRVKDTGTGLTKRERQKLFTLFERGITGMELDPDGSGIGLYIIKNIVEAHGGAITVASAGKGKGSTFGFRIPAS